MDNKQQKFWKAANLADKYALEFFSKRKKQVLSEKELRKDQLEENGRLLSFFLQRTDFIKKKGGFWLYFHQGEKCPVDGKELLGADLFLECYGQCQPECSPEDLAKAKELQQQIKNNSDPTQFTVHGPVPFQCPERHTLSYDGKEVTERTRSVVDNFIDYCVDTLGKAPGAYRE